MITDADIEKLKKVFATKEDLKEFITKEDLKQFVTKNDIILFKDQILYKIQKLRDDVAIVIGYRDMIEDHETRIGNLELKSS